MFHIIIRHKGEVFFLSLIDNEPETGLATMNTPNMRVQCNLFPGFCIEATQCRSLQSHTTL